MPELPEVETIARNLRPQLEGRTILSARLFWARTLAIPKPEAFVERIIGQDIQKVSRRAKYLHMTLSRGHLFIHLRMSGDLWIKPTNYTPQKHDRLMLELSDGNWLVFNDPRKFGRAWLVDDPEDVTGDLGIEPLDPAFTAEMLHSLLTKRKRQLKPLLLNQKFIAGLGNIYSDEALHLARLHPLTQSDTILIGDSKRLFESIRAVLQAGIENNGASIDWVYRGGGFQNHFRAYGRTGEPCPTCGTPIERIIVGQRSTHFCPSCQRLKV